LSIIFLGYDLCFSRGGSSLAECAQLAEQLAHEADLARNNGDALQAHQYAQQAKQAVELAEAALKETEAEVQKDPL
jgi:hypothetical protein